jgi:hypothetical protein
MNCVFVKIKLLKFICRINLYTQNLTFSNKILDIDTSGQHIFLIGMVEQIKEVLKFDK